MLELTRHHERQAFPAGLVDDGEDPELAPIMRPALDKAVGPHVPRIFRPEPDAVSVVEPESTTLRLALRHLQPFLTPNPLDTFAVHRPTGVA